MLQSQITGESGGGESAPLLELVGVSKSFGGVAALREVDFSLLAGEIHGLVGENGAGKSTTMKIIAGVHTDYEGVMRIDGREVRAPANSMLVDAAKHGDVEIPVFCYEPKLGNPVGACRMCLVEIEGIPKLQTACSTPVKDGLVVNTQTPRVHEAQRAVVEFLLINHPLDCPVCDKGGECPLQDITYGWGPGTSRFIEPKRHFKKPLELSPLIAIDRERCILCYRCVRFSQEISEDYQLILLERGAHSYVGTFDGHPYVGPFSGNITELCPVGALTHKPYSFSARPWELTKVESIDVMDAVGSAIRVDARGRGGRRRPHPRR